MDGVTKYPGQVTSAVCVKTSLNVIGGSFTWHNKGRAKSGQGQRAKERKNDRMLSTTSQLFA